MTEPESRAAQADSDQRHGVGLATHEGGRRLKDNPLHGPSTDSTQAPYDDGAASGSGAIYRQTACIKHLLYACPSVSLLRRQVKSPRKAKPRPNKPAAPGSGTATDLPISVAVPVIG